MWMKIQKEQYDALVAKLDAMQGSLKRYELISDTHGKAWIASWDRIERGQSILCERLDAVMKLLEGFALFHSFVLFEHKKRMDERYDLGWTRGLQYANAAVDTQSKAKPKRRNREAKKGR